MTRPRKKIPAQARFEPGIFRSLGGRLNHFSNEAVRMEESKKDRQRDRQTDTKKERKTVSN